MKLPCKILEQRQPTAVDVRHHGYLTVEGLFETRRKAKKKTLNKLLHDNDAVAVQETHGHSEHWATTRKQLDKSHKIFHSHDPESRNKAGVALFLKRKLYRQAFRDEVVEVNPGSTLTVRLFFAKGCLSFTSIHNFEMNETAQRQTAKHCADENRNAQNDEQGSSVYLIGGDFNFLARALPALYFKLRPPFAPTHSRPPANAPR